MKRKVKKNLKWERWTWRKIILLLYNSSLCSKWIIKYFKFLTMKVKFIKETKIFPSWSSMKMIQIYKFFKSFSIWWEFKKTVWILCGVFAQITRTRLFSKKCVHDAKSQERQIDEQIFELVTAIIGVLYEFYLFSWYVNKRFFKENDEKIYFWARWLILD